MYYAGGWCILYVCDGVDDYVCGVCGGLRMIYMHVGSPLNEYDSADYFLRAGSGCCRDITYIDTYSCTPSS